MIPLEEEEKSILYVNTGTHELRYREIDGISKGGYSEKDLWS